MANLWILGLVAVLVGTGGAAGAAMVMGPNAGGMSGMSGCAQMHARCRAEMAQCAEANRDRRSLRHWRV